MVLDAITLLLTYDCNAACEHCYYHSKPGRTGYITPEEARSYFDTIVKSWGRLSIVKILGGEPFVYYRPLLEIIRLASERGARVILLTNGVWGSSEKLADRVAQEMKQAGLSGAVIGASGFHAPFVPMEAATRAAAAANRRGIKAVIANYVLDSLEAHNEYDDESRRLAEICKEMDIFARTDHLDWQGRASGKLVQLSSAKTNIPTGTCPNVLIGKIKERTNYAHGVSIDAGGWVTICHGIAIGNTKHEPLDEIISRYSPVNHPITSVIREKGPIGLLDLPGAEAYKLEPKYKSLCHMCFDIRNHLRPHYPNELGPANCYQEV
jgi:MoaA/NifB/PqqE/SkfB family radical SAM enzyme